MTETAWQCRVDLPGTETRGSGFLVTDRHVLTCAHVVTGRDAAEVTLRNAGGPIPATVLREGPWWSPTAEAADIAVLELSAPAAGVEPARFAPFSAVELYAGQPLNALGFPWGYEQDGINATFTAGPGRELGRNVQVDAKNDFTVWLEGGFSGAAAVFSGRVLGMVRAAGQGDERVGVMVPVGELVRHVPRLDELIGLGTFGPRAYRDLRRALASVHVPHDDLSRKIASLQLMIESIPRHLTTLPALVEALVVEAMVEDGTMRHHLGGLLAYLGTREMSEWLAEHLPGSRGALPPIPPKYDGAIVVQLAPAADSGAEAYHLKVWTVSRPDGELTEPVVDKPGLARAQWQDEIEAAIEEALGRMPSIVDTVQVEFVLPRRFLALAVEEWLDRKDDDTPLGVSRPVVVRDLDWFTEPRPAALVRRVRDLREDGGRSLGEVLWWKDCGERPADPQVYKAWLRRHGGPPALVLAGEWTAAEHLGRAVAVGSPVMLWPRQACPADDHTRDDTCPGRWFRTEVTKRLHGITIDTVAELVRDLRAQAVVAAGKNEMHCGSGIVLLRDDARRRLEPLSFAE